MFSLFLAGSVALRDPIAEAASCAAFRPVVEIAVRQGPVSVRTDFSLAALDEMSARSVRKPRHPVLGFYKSTLEYAFRVGVESVPSSGGDPCARITVIGQIAGADRQIEIGRELKGDPCAFHAALAHYLDHAAAEGPALKRSATALVNALRPEITRYAESHLSQIQTDNAGLRDYVSGLLRRAIDAISTSLRMVQADVDSPEEIHKLASSCGGDAILGSGETTRS